MAGSLIYGPVPSRRLGLSLGVDIVPFKECSYNCVYCQIGPTKKTTLDRKSYVTAQKILPQLADRLNNGISPDYITLGGSGEPTLNTEISQIIDKIKKLTSIPVALLTNGSLLSDASVRQEISHADVVLPSLDAADAESFMRINRPHPDIDFKKMVTGLIDFRKMYAGEIWLEIFFIEGINATDDQARSYMTWLKKIRPDKIHLNTAVRPAAESYIKPVSKEKLQHFCTILGSNAEVIASFKHKNQTKKSNKIKEGLLEMISRRPCTLDDISSGLNLNKTEIIKHIDPLVEKQILEVVRVGEQLFYQKRGNPAG